jgi:hypothetical protein
MILMFFLAIGITSPSPVNKFSCKIVEKKRLETKKLHIDTTMAINDSLLIQYLTIKQFKDTLGKYESWNTYNITNKWGFKGKYQFSDYMIRRFANVKPSYFLRNAQIQEKSMDKVCKFYVGYIYRYNYTKYINTEVDGVTVTMEALMLGCHFSPLYLMWWLESNGQLNPRDANITIKEYMKRFENKGNILIYKELQCKNL